MNAETTLNKISMDRWRWIIQGRIEGEERDQITMLENAERRGKEATVREVARNLLKLGVVPETVAQGCSLPLEEVLALQEDRNAQPVAQ